MRRRYNKNTFYLLSILFVISFICYIMKFEFMSKALSDSRYILSLMENNTESSGTAFYVTAEMFKRINFLNFTSLEQWSCLLAVVFTFVVFMFFLKNEKYKTNEYIFIYASFALLNLFVFNLSKDIIQFIVFCIIFLITMSKRISYKSKCILISVILLMETIFFRSYYILILYAFILLNIIYNKYSNSKKIHTKSSIGKMIFMSVVIFLIPIAISQYIFPSQYNSLINVRETVTSGLTANTEINNIINGNNFVTFALNYIINGIRIFFPLELFTKGITQIIFAIYQLFLTSLLIKSIKKIRKENLLSVLLIVSYFLGAIVFEPDFGSVVRHEITLLLFFVFMNHDINWYSQEVKNE